MPINHRELWDTKYLKAQLATRAMPEGKTFWYFLAMTGFDWLQFSANRLSPGTGAINDWERAGVLSSFFLTILGLVFVFLRNGGVQGKDFFYRYFPLSVVVGWKFMVSAFATLWLIGLAMQNFPSSTAGWAATSTLAAFNIAMFLRIGRHMGELAHANTA